MLAVGFVMALFKHTGPVWASLERLSRVFHVHENTKLFYFIYNLTRLYRIFSVISDQSSFHLTTLEEKDESASLKFDP